MYRTPTLNYFLPLCVLLLSSFPQCLCGHIFWCLRYHTGRPGCCSVGDKWLGLICPRLIYSAAGTILRILRPLPLPLFQVEQQDESQSQIHHQRRNSPGRINRQRSEAPWHVIWTKVNVRPRILLTTASPGCFTIHSSLSFQLSAPEMNYSNGQPVRTVVVLDNTTLPALNFISSD